MLICYGIMRKQTVLFFPTILLRSSAVVLNQDAEGHNEVLIIDQFLRDREVYYN